MLVSFVEATHQSFRFVSRRKSTSPRQRRIALAQILAFSLGLAPSLAFAQFSALDDPTARFEWRGQVRSKFQAEFKTRTAGGDSFESWTTTIAGDFGGPINESILVGIDAAYQYSNYEFRLDGAPGVPSVYGSAELPRDPWGPINTVDITPSATILIGDRFSLAAAIPIRYSGETGSRRSAVTGGASALVRWQITEGIRIGAGLGVTSQLEENAETFPIVSFDWTITSDMQFRTEGSWTQGGLASLLWGPNEAIRIRFSAGYERNRFRLDDNGFVADRNGIGEITSVPLEVGLRLRLYEDAYFDFHFGLAFAGHIRVENSTGDKLYEQSYDPAPRIGLALTLPFGLPSRSAPGM